MLALNQPTATTEARAVLTEAIRRDRFNASAWRWLAQAEGRLGNKTAASLAARCMRSPTAQFFHEHAFAKESGTQKATPWHHDLPYYCIDGSQTASVYVALDDTPAETAVRFLAGSHRDGNTYVPRRFRTGNDYDYDDPSMVSAPRFDGDDDDEPIIARSLTAGDAIVFDFRTLHGTTDAPVSTRRRAFSTRWLGDDVRYVERAGVTSPPLDLDLDPGDRMPESLFPTLWRDR